MREEDVECSDVWVRVGWIQFRELHGVLCERKMVIEDEREGV
jgi:hypothetical protein